MMKIVFALLFVAVAVRAQIGVLPVQSIQPLSTWTKWFDRDDPSITGDWEVMSALYPKPCGGKPLRLEVRVKGDPTVVASTSERITVGPNYGLKCVNAIQADNKCLDYSVQYLVPRISKKFDRDDPTLSGDWELKSLETGPAWKNGRFIYWYANDVNYGLVDELLELGPRYGLLCKNSVQADKQCRDYEVRFLCPLILTPKLPFLKVARPQLPLPT